MASDSQDRFSPGDDPGNTSGFGGRAINMALKYRRWLIGFGIAGSIAGLILAVFLGFLATFKLMFMKENIDRTRLARMTHILDSRSDRFVNSMIAAEVAGEEDGKNRYFVANGWDSNHPYYSFFEKITGRRVGSDQKINKFFDEIEQRNGYRFVRETSGIGSRDRLVRIEMNGQQIDFSDLESRNGLTDLDDLVAERFENNKAGRLAWKNAVKDNTKFYQVIKRYNMRKWGYEKLGITKWRFFEGTRENAEQRVRSRWTRAVSARQLSGSFTRCLLSGQCPESSSLNDERNTADLTPDPDTERALEETEGETRSSDEPVVAGHFATKFTSKLIPIINFIDIGETIKGIDDLLGKGGLVKLVAVTRSAEYATSYLTFATMTDHLKAGEKASGEEVNAVMKMVENMEQSEGYKQVVGYSPTSPFLISQAHAQANIAEITENMKVNSTDNKAFALTAFYNQTFGTILGPLADAYGGITDLPIIGDIINGAFDLIGFVTEGITWTFGKISGTNPESIFKSLFSKLIEYFGGAPACSGDEAGGQLFNCLDGGASVIQEAFLEANGAHDITEEQHVSQSRTAALDQTDMDMQRSPWSRLASLDGSNSVLAKLLMMTPSSDNNYRSLQSNLASASPFGVLQTIGQKFGTVALSLFSPTYAAAEDTNPYGVKRKGLTDEELKRKPYGGKDKTQCQQEIDAHNAAVNKGESSTGSLCLMDDMVSNALTCYNSTDETCATVAGQSGDSEVTESGELVTGSDKELACEIKNNSNIHLIGTNVQADIDAACQGHVGPSGVKINSKLLQIIATMGKNHKFNISSLIRPGDSDSAHSTGEGVDITGLDGNPIAQSGLGRTEKEVRLMKEISPLLPKPSGWGQIGCGPEPDPQLPRGIDQFRDTCHHLHLEINH